MGLKFGQTLKVGIACGGRNRTIMGLKSFPFGQDVPAKTKSQSNHYGIEIIVHTSYIDTCRRRNRTIMGLK